MLASSKIFADETTLPVQKPGNGRTKSAYLWGYAVDDRPWLRPSPPLVVYVHADGRGGKHVAKHLERFSCVVQIASAIIETCRLNHVEPFAYLKDILERMVSGQTKANWLDELILWNWEASDHG